MTKCAMTVPFHGTYNDPITRNERAWIEFIRLITMGTDPVPTLGTVQRLQRVFKE